MALIPDELVYRILISALRLAQPEFFRCIRVAGTPLDFTSPQKIGQRLRVRYDHPVVGRDPLSCVTRGLLEPIDPVAGR